MNTRHNRMLALLLAVMLTFSLLPVSALAVDGEIAAAEPVELSAESSAEVIAQPAAETVEDSTEKTAETPDEVTVEETTEETREESTVETTEESTVETTEETTVETTEEAVVEAVAEESLPLDGEEAEWSVTLNDAQQSENPLLYTFSWTVTAPESANISTWIELSPPGTDSFLWYFDDPAPDGNCSSGVAIEPGRTLCYRAVLEDCDTGVSYTSEQKSVTVPVPSASEGEFGTTYAAKSGELYRFSDLAMGLYILDTTDRMTNVYMTRPYDSSGLLGIYSGTSERRVFAVDSGADVYFYASQDASFCLVPVADANVPALSLGTTELTEQVYRVTTEEGGLYRLTSDVNAQISLYNSYGGKEWYNIAKWPFSLEGGRDYYFYVEERYLPVTVTFAKVTPDDAQKVELDTAVVPQENQLYIFTAPAAGVYYLDDSVSENFRVYRETGIECGNQFSLEKDERVYILPVYLEGDESLLVRDFRTAPKTPISLGRNTGLEGTLFEFTAPAQGRYFVFGDAYVMRVLDNGENYYSTLAVYMEEGQKLWLLAEAANLVTELTVMAVSNIDSQAQTLPLGETATVEPGVFYRFDGAADTYYMVETTNCVACFFDPEWGYYDYIERMCQLTGTYYFYVKPDGDGTMTLRVRELAEDEYTPLELDTAATFNGQTACIYTPDESGLYVLMDQEYNSSVWVNCSYAVESPMSGNLPIMRLTAGQTVRFLVNNGYGTQMVLKRLSADNTAALTAGEEKTASHKDVYSFTAQETGYYRVKYTYDYPEYVGGPSGSGAIFADGDEISTYWHMIAGETVFFYANEARTICVDPAAAPQTIEPGQTVSGTGPFDITVPAGEYFIQVDNDCLLNIYRSGVWYGCVLANERIYFEQTVEYRIIPDQEVTNLRVVTIMDANFPTLTDGQTETKVVKGYEGYFRFTAPQTGNYLIRHTAPNAMLYQDGERYGWECTDGTIIRLAAGKSIVVGVFDYSVDSVQTWECEIGVSNLKDVSVTPISAGETKTVADDALFGFTPQEDAIYIAESSDGTFQCHALGNVFGSSNLAYFGATKDVQVLLAFRTAAESGSLTLRKATEEDMQPVSCGVSYPSGGYYRFTSDKDATYRMVGSTFCEICGTDGAQIEAGYGVVYFHVNAGETVYLASQSGPQSEFRVEEYAVPALTVGTWRTLDAEMALYSFTASENGMYIIRASGANDIAATTISIVKEDNYWINLDSAKVLLPVEMTAGQKITLRLDCYDESGAVRIDKQEDVLADDLTLGVEKTTGEAGEIYRFVPQQDGLYVVSANGAVYAYSIGGYNSGQSSGESKLLLQLEKGEACYILAENSSTTVTMQTVEQYDSAELSGEATAMEATVYSFTPSASGLYTMSASGCVVYSDTGSYGIQSIIYGSGSTVVSLKKDETAYFLACPQQGSGSISIARTDMSAYDQLSLNEKKVIVEDTELAFEAPADGQYVICSGGVAYSSILVDGGNRSLPATNTAPALVTLQKGQQLYINVRLFGFLLEVDATVQVVKLEDYAAITTISTGETKNLVLGQFYHFTAEEAGEYTIRMTDETGAYGWGRVYGQEVNGYVDNYAGDPSSMVVTMAAGESVYILVGEDTASTVALIIEKSGESGESGGESGGETGGETTEPEDVAQTLGSLAADSTKTDAEKREEIQNMDTETLKETLATSEEAVENLKTIEEAAGSADVRVELSHGAESAGLTQVEIVGAALNEKESENAEITLKIDTATAQDVPASLDESKAVYLSLELEGVKDSTNLAVPVCITLKVPDNIHWELVRLVHHTADGKTEILEPTSYVENGVRYARFVIGGFSPFTLTELKHVAGDVNGSGIKDIIDVLALLKYVAGIDANIIYGDVNNDGVVTILDVLALLKSVAGIAGSEIY